MHTQVDTTALLTPTDQPSLPHIHPQKEQKGSPSSPQSPSIQSDPASSPEIAPSTDPTPAVQPPSLTTTKPITQPPVPPPASGTPETPPPSTSQKKKKKRKNSRTLNESTPLPNESSIRGDGLDDWRARAYNRRTLLAKANSDNALLTADLTAALARVADAEHAEATVNKGLLTARSVISQRDKVVAELTSAHQQLKGEHAKVLEDKKRAEKRLVILKTVGANLQELREGKEFLERKLEDSGATNTRLAKEIEKLENRKAELEKEVAELRMHVEELQIVKKELMRMEELVEELRWEREELKVVAKRDSVRAAGIGAAGAFALSITLRLLGGGRK